MRYAFFGGKIVDFEDAKVSVLTHALNYGTGVFEGIRGYYNAEKETMFILKLRDHYERLMQSAGILLMDVPYTVDQLCSITIDLVRKHNYSEDCYIRPLVYKSSCVIGVRLHNLDSDITVFTAPLGAYIDITRGIRVRTSSWRRVDDSMIPARAKICGSYVNSAFAKTEAATDGYDEAIMLTHDGHVSEGSAENIFICRKGTWITPPVNENLLEGITRAAVMELIRNELNQKVIERPIDRTELYVCDEMFLCGTGAQISPVIEADNRKVGTGAVGPYTRQIQDLYFAIVRGNNDRYSSWVVPVKQ